MAFLRVEKKKSGTYLRIIQSFKLEGKSKHKTIHSLGKVEDYTADQLERIAKKLIELTGGDMLRIEIVPEQGGVCYTRGGWRILILPAGYLGSMLWGNLLIILAARTKWDKQITIVLGIIILLISFLFVRNSFGFAFSIVFGIALILSGWLL